MDTNDAAIPVDPNNVTGKKVTGNAETDNRPPDINNVTSDKAVGNAETDNRPAKPTV
jgi:hypothetical protein